jgi:DNA topoisomerase-2
MAKSIEQTFIKLNEVQHCLLRPGRYIGSIKPHTALEFIPNVKSATDVAMERREVTYNPGFLKLFDEVISNSADHSKRPEGRHLDTIRVEVDRDKGEISVYDNGGIPVVKHKEYNQWVPEMIFELRAGSNFDDSEQATLTGQNGEGAALTCIFSTKFRVETCDGKNRFLMTFSENSQHRPPAKVEPAKGDKGYTRITYHPDFEKLGMEGIDQDNYDMLLARVYEIAATNTHLKVYFNGTRVMTRTFKDYVEMFTGKDGEYVFDDGESFKVAVAKSDDGFQHTSFVNTTRTKIGGTHIAYVVNQIVDELRTHINKKLKKAKVEVKPADIRNHLHLFIDATIVNPRYSSQTKDELITEAKDYGRSWAVPEKFIKKLLQTEIIQSILDWVEAKEQAEAMKELRKLNKETDKADPRRVPKFSDALEKRDRQKCVLFLTEGDSAAKAVQAGRGKNPYIASFPLRGKPLNVREKDVKRILENEEIKNLMTIIGLKLGEKVTSLAQLRFGKIAFTTDADVDGAHISGLLMNVFDTFWPELFQLGVIHVFRTPLVKITAKGKDPIEFFTEREFHAWEKKDGAKLRGWSHKYYKGLGTSSAAEFRGYFERMDNYLFRIDVADKDDKDSIDLAFNGQRADDRKKWLETPAANFEDFIMEAA